jgi:hypothetical protein
MPHLLPRVTVVVAAVLSVSLAASAAGAVAQAGDRVRATPGAAPAARTALGAALTLVDGDRVLASSAPGPSRAGACRSPCITAVGCGPCPGSS